jgi:hypothetical protein
MIAADLAEQRDAFVKSELSGFSAEQIESCAGVKSQAQAQLKFHRTAASIRKAEQLYGDDSNRVVDYLQQKNPFAADCYRQRKRAFATTAVPKQYKTDKIVEALLIEQLDEAINLINASDQNERAVQFWQAARFLPVADLLAYGLSPGRNDFAHAVKLNTKNFSLLLSTQWDFSWASPHGHNLLTYASAKCNLKRAAVLHEENYPYSYTAVGTDALAYTLANCSHRRVEKMVDILMRFKPEVNALHRGLLSALRLEHLPVYRAIVQAHPGLEVMADTQPELYESCDLP